MKAGQEYTARLSPTEVYEDRGNQAPTGWPVHQKATQAGLLTSASVTVAACGGGSGSSTSESGPSNNATGLPTPLQVSRPEAARFLLQTSLSASEEKIDKVISSGSEPWLEDQISRPVEFNARSFFRSRGFDQVNTDAHFQRDKTADYMIWNQLMSGGGEVRKRVALALSEFFVVSVADLDMPWPALAIGAYWDLLCEHAFGNYRDLLEAVTLSPAMANYLDTIGNQKADTATNRAPDENFAREVMQLFSIGLEELNNDGTSTIRVGQSIPTFSNDDVMGLARCFTGYNYDYSETTIADHPAAPGPLETPDFLYVPVTADPGKWKRPGSSSLHSDDMKSFLGVEIAAGTGPEETLKIALDTLFNHPNVGPFFGKQMIQRLITSNPSAAFVQRVASVFNDNGNGERGDLAAVFKAIFLDEEARGSSGLENPKFGKVREPILRIAQWARTFEATSLSGDWTVDSLARDYDQLAQSPFRSPSAFNFFRPSYVATGSQAEQNGMVAPEFEILNETSVAGYVNFIQLMTEDRSFHSRDVKATFGKQIELAGDPETLIDHLNLVMTANQMSQDTRETILEAIRSVSISSSTDMDGKRRRVRIGVILTMASMDYLIQK